MAEDIFIGDHRYSVYQWHAAPDRSILRMNTRDRVTDVVSRFRGDIAAMTCVRNIVSDHRPGLPAMFRTDYEILQLFTDMILEGELHLVETERPEASRPDGMEADKPLESKALWDAVGDANADLATALPVAAAPLPDDDDDNAKVEDITPDIEDVRVEVLETMDELDLAIAEIGAVQVEVGGIGGSIGEVSTLTGDATAQLQTASSDASASGGEGATVIGGAASGVSSCLSDTAKVGADANAALSQVGGLGGEMSGLMSDASASMTDSVGQASSLMGG